MARKHHPKSAVHRKNKTTLDYTIWLFSVATPLFELPQTYAIYAHHDAQNVSGYTWSFFLIDNLVWIIYGIKHKSKPLILTSVLYFLIEASIVYGIVLYGSPW